MTKTQPPDHKYLENFKKNLSRDIEQYEKLISEINAQFEKDDHAIGRVLKCHLIIEKYVNDLLQHEYGKQFNYKKANLRFSQKLTLLEGLEYDIIYIPGIKEITAVRNKLAHNLDYDISSCKLPICKRIAEFMAEKGRLDPVEVIEVFTNTVCAWIGFEISEYGQERRRQRNNL